MLRRGVKPSQKSSTMMRVALELKENFSINSISFQSSRTNLRFQRYAHQDKAKGKFNGKENIASLAKTSMIYQENQGKAQKTIQPINNRPPLSSLANRKTANSFYNPLPSPKKYALIKTKEKIEFYDELFDKTVKVKKFREDDIPFTHSRILPKVQWMKIDNDIKTDDEQLEDGKKMLHNWLGDTIKLIKEDSSYLANNIDRNFLMLRNTNNNGKR